MCSFELTSTEIPVPDPFFFVGSGGYGWPGHCTSFLVKYHKRSSSTEFPTSSERTGTNFSAAKKASVHQAAHVRPTRTFTFRVHWSRLLCCKASVHQLARKNSTTDVISRYRTAFFLLTSTVIPILVPDIHLQSALVQTYLLQASVDQPARVYCDNKERT